MEQKEFSKSERMKLWHQRARVQQDIFKNQFPDEKLPEYSEFLKMESRVIKNIVMYEVSFQVNYQGEYEHFILPKQTFKVYGIANQSHDIEFRTMNMVQTAKGKNSKEMFSPETIEMLESELSPDAVEKKTEEEKESNYISVKPRGIEKGENIFSQPVKTKGELVREIEELKTLAFNKYVVKDLDKTYKFTNKKKRTGEMVMDITNFL